MVGLAQSCTGRGGQMGALLSAVALLGIDLLAAVGAHGGAGRGAQCRALLIGLRGQRRGRLGGFVPRSRGVAWPAGGRSGGGYLSQRRGGLLRLGHCARVVLGPASGWPWALSGVGSPARRVCNS